MDGENKKALTPEVSEPKTKTIQQTVSEIEAELSSDNLVDLAKQIDRADEMLEQGIKEMQDVVAEIEAVKRKVDQLYEAATAKAQIALKRLAALNGGGK
jgi:hypothetical protein